MLLITLVEWPYPWPNLSLAWPAKVVAFSCALLHQRGRRPSARLPDVLARDYETRSILITTILSTLRGFFDVQKPQLSFNPTCDDRDSVRTHLGPFRTFRSPQLSGWWPHCDHNDRLSSFGPGADCAGTPEVLHSRPEQTRSGDC